jgi:hypothetical protein
MVRPTIRFAGGESAILRAAPGALCVHESQEEWRKNHAQSFKQTARSQSCNLKELHSQRDASSRDMENRYAPRRRSRIESIFVAIADLMLLFPASEHF